ncbi:MAG: hypothetical protein M3457_05365 [Chloroflexota bacterium]|nr:hypothetical protein [Chloroflexota bacterium]
MPRMSSLVCLMLVLVLGASAAASTFAQPQRPEIDCQNPEFIAICLGDAPIAVPEQEATVVAPGTDPILVDIEVGPVLACIEPGPDTDGDGLSDACESALGTDPDDWDTDGDGYSDEAEHRLGRDPLVFTNDDDTVDYGGVVNATVTPPPPNLNAPGDCTSPGFVVLCLEDTGPLVSDVAEPDGDGPINEVIESGGLAIPTYPPSLPPGEASGDCQSDFITICFDDGPVMLSDDFDGDGLANDREAWLGTDPYNPDTDGDGVDDGQEMRNGTDPVSHDAGPAFAECGPEFVVLCLEDAPLSADDEQHAGDGYISGDDVPGTVPTTPDDGPGSSACRPDFLVQCLEDVPLFDGTPTGLDVVDEVTLSCHATVADSDGDGLTDACEAEEGSDPDNPDTDGDSLGDGNEVNQYGTDPLDADTDQDGLDDGFDLGSGLDPLDSDYDNDGLLDGEEVNAYGTYPKIRDSDGDGMMDVEEVRIYGTDRLNEDTDGDGVFDRQEVIDDTDPLINDNP